MTKQDKKEIIQAINKSTKTELGKLETKVLGAIDQLAVATKKGFDEAQKERYELSERLEFVEAGVYRLENSKTQQTR